ncbi:MAG TPA: glycohydrolase toxin TNT-related protein [Chthonomonadales bacterium]|nr:glycohydrolase toxin TNT-related protein [Chthonomonadales bacterium]
MNGGRFVTNPGVPPWDVALPRESRGWDTYANMQGPATAWIVVKPVPVLSGPAGSWSTGPGGGWQYKLPKSVEWLRLHGYLRLAG